MPLTYSIALLALFYLLLIGEFFVPSAGMVGVAAVITGLTSVTIAFTHSVAAGCVVSGTILVSTPAILFAMIRYWPHTVIGKRILNRRPGQIDEPTESRLRGGQKRKDLVGQTGVAKTDLLPAGLVVINGQRLDAVSEGAAIDAGQTVKVISTVAGKIRVRMVEPDDQPVSTDTPDRTPTAIETTLETLDFDAMED